MISNAQERDAAPTVPPDFTLPGLASEIRSRGDRAARLALFAVGAFALAWTGLLFFAAIAPPEAWTRTPWPLATAIGLPPVAMAAVVALGLRAIRALSRRAAMLEGDAGRRAARDREIDPGSGSGAGETAETPAGRDRQDRRESDPSSPKSPFAQSDADSPDVEPTLQDELPRRSGKAEPCVDSETVTTGTRPDSEPEPEPGIAAAEGEPAIDPKRSPDGALPDGGSAGRHLAMPASSDPVASSLASTHASTLQAPLDLGIPALPKLSEEMGDFLRAMNFPDSVQDSEGFAALRRVRLDPQADTLLRAAEDVLNLLGKDGIYMEDIPSTPPAPALWRALAGGERGQGLGEHCAPFPPVTAARVETLFRNDTVFRDAALFFLQRFDKFLTRFVPEATDPELALFGQTRTARAFALVARVSGKID